MLVRFLILGYCITELTDFPYKKREKCIYKMCYILISSSLLTYFICINKIILILLKYPFSEMF